MVRYIGEDLGRTAGAAVPLAHGRKSIFFTQGRADTERVRQAFEEFGLPVFVHHSSVSKDFREEAEAKFVETEGPATLVSTSTLELGIDVGDLDVVLQLDAPSTVSSFLQRMGRTGRRAETTQHCEFFTSDGDSLLQAIALVNLARQKFVEKVEPSPRNTPVLVHQILAQVMEHAAVGRRALWSALRGPHPFSAVDRAMFDRVVDHLVETGILDELDGLLVFGEEESASSAGRTFSTCTRSSRHHPRLQSRRSTDASSGHSTPISSARWRQARSPSCSPEGSGERSTWISTALSS